MINNKIKQAVALAGGQTATANELKVSGVTVFGWCKNGRVPNLAKARQLSTLSGIAVEDLRPTLLEMLEVAA